MHRQALMFWCVLKCIIFAQMMNVAHSRLRKGNNKAFQIIKRWHAISTYLICWISPLCIFKHVEVTFYIVQKHVCNEMFACDDNIY